MVCRLRAKTRRKEAAETVKKICVFCETWESGGIESFLYNVISRMDRSGLEIHLVAARLSESVFTAPMEALGVRFIPLSGSPRRVLTNHRLFRRLLRRERYELLHLNLFQGMSLDYARIAREEGVPVRIAHSHNTALRRSPLRPLKLLLHRLYAHFRAAEATDFWACSRPAAEFLFPKKLLAARGFRFIPSGIDTARVSCDAARRDELRRGLGLDGAFTVGCVGRLCYQKNQGFALETFDRLRKLRPNSMLLLVGDGPDRAALEERAAALGQRERVIFTGTSSRVEELFWAMDAFVFPSRFEGLGIVAVEAQASGLPTLCSEHVPDEAAVTPLFRRLPLSGGSEAWAEALAALTPGERDGFAQRVTEAGFELRDVARLIETFYRDSAGSRR